MQLIVNTKSTETEKMSTLEQESLIEKPLVNGALQINDVVKVIDEKESSIKENIEVEQSRVINAEENSNPEPTQDDGHEDKAKVFVDDSDVANEGGKQDIVSMKPDCPDNRNGTGNINIIFEETNLIKTEPSEEIPSLGLESSAACVNNDSQKSTFIKVAEIKGVDTDSSTSIKSELNADITEIDNAEEDNYDVAKVKSEHSPQMTCDDEMGNLENKGDDTQTLTERDVSDIQGTTQVKENENKNNAISENLKDDIHNVGDKSKNNHHSQVITESTIVENENENVSATLKTEVLDSVENENNADVQLSANPTKVIENKDNDTRIVHDDVDLDEVKIVEDNNKEGPSNKNEITPVAQKVEEKKTCTSTIRLSNTLDILSDDDEEEEARALQESSPKPSKVDTEKETRLDVAAKCINLDDDDDIMLIDDVASNNDQEEIPNVTAETRNNDLNTEPVNTKQIEGSKIGDDSVIPENPTSPKPTKQIVKENTEEKCKNSKPIIPENFFKNHKKKITEMTRDDLEEFCIVKLVESIIDRGNLSDMKSKIKIMAQGMEEYKKKVMMLTKQNRDLQVVLKSIQEELKNKSRKTITPLKITRSVGMQVIMPDSTRSRRRQNTAINHTTNVQTNVNHNTNRPQRTSNQNQRLQKQASTQQSIPVPRLVPATNTNVTNKPAQTTAMNNAKATTPMSSGAKNSPPLQKTAEKRTHSRTQSVTVDLTDDEPPAKQMTKSSPVPPVRLVPSQNIMTARQQFAQNSPRKVYIPISGPQAQNIRTGQTVLLKSVQSSPAPRPVRPPMVRMPQSPVRTSRGANYRHPAPLPDAMKQYQPPNWKALPPPPDLKLSKVENGIVISWKIDGYQDDSYEEIASYQLYAYQETTSPPNTALWKKIGDVKALPLPMACTLTQFMAGYKYYFAVRAVDIRSRVGPFSLPGSILLLNKM